MEKSRFKVGDEVIYIGVWTKKVGTICKVLEVRKHGGYSVDLGHKTGVGENSIRKLTKLEKALK